MTGKSLTAASRLASADKRDKAMKLRKLNYSYDEIARAVGCSTSHAHRLVTEELAKLRECIYSSAEDLRTLQGERIAYATNKVMIDIHDGNLTSVDKLCKLMDREAKLYGLDAASRTEISGALTASAEWVELRSVLLLTLGKYPDAREAVLRAIAPAEAIE